MDWREENRANWDERVGVHLGAPMYDLSDLRAGKGRLTPIEEAGIGDVSGLDLLHLQCHFGRDTLTLAQKGARVTGLDFSPRAIEEARRIAADLGIEAHFVESDALEADVALPHAAFDMVFTTWGTIGWLPDVTRWAEVIAALLRPGGRLYFADTHPVVQGLVSGDPLAFGDPYFLAGPITEDDPRDYADEGAQLSHARQTGFQHTTAQIVTALLSAGLTITRLAEHDTLPYRMVPQMEEGPEGMFHWPGNVPLPLALEIEAVKP